VMKERVDLRTFAAHIEPTYPLTYADGLLTVYAPEPDWCADRMTKLAERFLVGACNQAISVEFAP